MFSNPFRPLGWYQTDLFVDMNADSNYNGISDNNDLFFDINDDGISDSHDNFLDLEHNNMSDVITVITKKS